MSAYFAKHGKPEKRKYSQHGRTKQSQKNQCDINKLLEKAARSGSLSHLDKFEARYGDFSDFDFTEHAIKMAEGQTIFENLPGEVKREFDQSPDKFFKFVTDPQNAEKLPELLPAIANRGEYFPPIGIIQTRAPDAPETPTTGATPPQAATVDTPPQNPASGE